MRLVGIDGIDLRRLRGQVGQRVASAGRNGDDRRPDRQLQCGKIRLRIFPDLGVDQTTQPKRVDSVPDRRFILCTFVTYRVCNQLRAHASLESTMAQRYRWRTSVLRQWRSALANLPAACHMLVV